MKYVQAILTKILTFTLCVCLLNFSVQISRQGLEISTQSAMAETTDSDTSTANEEAKITKQINTDLEGKGDSFGSGAMSVVLMLALGYIGSTLFFHYTPMPMDMMIAVAGCVIYITGEIMAFSDFKKMKSKTMSASIAEDGEIDEKQFEALKAQKQLYNDVIETAETKKMLQMAASAAFAMAAISAYLEIAEEVALEAPIMLVPLNIPVVIKKRTYDIVPKFSIAKTPVRTMNCAQIVAVANSNYLSAELALDIAYKTYTACVNAVPYAAACLAPTTLILAEANAYLATCNTALTASHGLMAACEKNSTTQTTPYVTVGISDDFSKFAATLINLELNKFDTNMSYEVLDPAREDNSMSLFGEIISTFSNLIMPQAHASAEKIGFAGAGLAIILGVIGVMQKQLDLYWSSPQTRAISYGVIAGLTYAASNQTKNVIETSEKNIVKIDNVLTIASNLAKLQEINASTSTDLGLQVLAVGDLGFKIPTEDIILTETTPCAKPGSKPGACGSVQAAIEGDGSFGLLGSNFAAYASTAGAIADGFSGTNVLSPTTMNTTGDLANGGAAINKMLEKQKRKINQQRKKQGRAAINFDKLENDLLSSMRKNTGRVLERNGSSPSSLLASIGQSGKGVTKSKASNKKSKVKKSIKTKARAGGYKLKKGGFNLDLDNDQITSDEMSANVDQLASADDLNEDHGDIVNNPDADIFKIISVRYMKSGYSKLLEEK